MTFGENIERLGWKQGAFLPPDLIGLLISIGGLEEAAPKGSLHVIVSQSCDVVHDSPEAEPWCEVLRLRRVDKLNPALEHGRNPRIFHFKIQEMGTAVACSVEAKERFFLKRELLSNKVPYTNLEVPEAILGQLTGWLANRYIRPALPTEFNKRLRADTKQLKKLKALVGTYHWLFRDFYLDLRPFDEITDPKTKYRVELLLVAPEEAFARSRTELDSFRRQLEENLKQCAGIEVADVRLLPDTRTSLRLLDDYVAWDDFDYLTARDDASEPATAASKD